MGKLIKEKQDLTYLEFSKMRKSSGTAGTFLKATSNIDGKKIYYKLSNYDDINGFIGIESINEFVVDRLLDILEIKHLQYDLIYADVIIHGKKIDTYLCASKDYKDVNEDKMALDVFYELNKNNNETPLAFLKRYHFEKQIYNMIVVDFLILNRDRHGANIEVLKNNKDKLLRLAPLFDHGFSLLTPYVKKEDIVDFDVMQDRQIQSFFASRSAYDNLKLIEKDKLLKIKKFSEDYKEVIFKDLDDIIDDFVIDKMWQLISNRWRYYEDFCNKR